MLICGIPNSGKSTLSQEYINCVHYDDVNLITCERYAYICDKARTEDVTVEGVYGESRRRTELAKAYHEGGYTATCLWLDVPEETCLMRERNGRKRGDHLVRHYAKIFEPPTLEEGWDEIIIIRGENEEIIKRGDLSAEGKQP